MRAELGRATWERLNQIRKRRRVQNLATLGLVALGPALVLATFLVLGPLALSASSLRLRLVVLADLVYVLVVAALVLHRIAKMVSARRAKSVGSQLHLRLTGVFALVALVPTVMVAVFAGLTLNIGLEGWFSERVREVVGASRSAAEAYEEEHRRNLETDAEVVAAVINAQYQPSFLMSDGDFRQILSQAQQQVQRGLKEAYVIDGTPEIRARGERSYLFDYESPNADELATARRGETVIIRDWDNNEFRALIALDAYVDRFLLVSRSVDGDILNLLDDTQKTAALYEQLERERGRMLFEFGLLYLGFALILILAAIWLGLWFADRLSRPVGRLASAAQRVGEGNLDVQVPEPGSDDEIAMLGHVFNQMTRQLKAQRESLLESNREIDERRRLFDSVLWSVTSGVAGIDAEGRVDFINRAGSELLHVREGDVAGRAILELVPEFGPLLDQLRSVKSETAQQEVKLRRRGVQDILLVRMAVRRSKDGELEGFVVAFDDITDLVSAQRMAAWGDVARRIAHEIKNPLTPIQLSAERITRKYGRRLEPADAEALGQLTSVIIRQTNDLRRIVDEFSKFARMPQPEQSRQDLSKLVQEAVILQSNGNLNVTISCKTPDDAVPADLDPTLLSQALTNLIKNAIEATETYVEKFSPEGYKPEVRVTLSMLDGTALLTVDDNGTGFPEDRARLFEPYVTTRDSGTGLGLPIVRKIIEEHGGRMRLEDAPAFAEGAHHGARVSVTLPIETEAVADAAE
ncbi:sensor histidine kinase NtrY-like [Qingshengfaniella alkalisoli]|uniref:histidine kinase n=1 Tax=Qingshengfaniella alkalisoli TaxID=2599296 RepID=A0A5B8IWV6_9RHOB|nr:PAS domain-containing sensor histidine kinase [Qingshengfaniella alkalisoli]QDY69038.1 PAS domain-containing sensor histidine kinase [Qingshengfaniella alkalisoli]